MDSISLLETEDTDVSKCEISLSVHYLEGITIHTFTAPPDMFYNSTHIIETENSLFIVDSQFLKSQSLLFRDYVDFLTRKGKDIDKILVSHAHIDHWLGLQAFDEYRDKIVSTPNVINEIFEKGEQEIGETQQTMKGSVWEELIVPDYFSEIMGEDEYILDGIRMRFWVVKDAESKEQIVFYLPQFSVLFAGDLLYNNYHMWLEGNLSHWIEELKNLRSLDVDYVLCGHGSPVLREDIPELYRTNIQYLEKAKDALAKSKEMNNFDILKSALTISYPHMQGETLLDIQISYMEKAELTNLNDSNIIKSNTSLSEMGQKYCRCLVKVAEKQPRWCLREKAWRQKRGGETCYNPYAICTKSVKRKGSISCFNEYEISNMTENQKRSLANLHGKSVEDL